MLEQTAPNNNYITVIQEVVHREYNTCKSNIHVMCKHITFVKVNQLRTE